MMHDRSAAGYVSEHEYGSMFLLHYLHSTIFHYDELAMSHKLFRCAKCQVFVDHIQYIHSSQYGERDLDRHEYQRKSSLKNNSDHFPHQLALKSIEWLIVSANYT